MCHIPTVLKTGGMNTAKSVLQRKLSAVRYVWVSIWKTKQSVVCDWSTFININRLIILFYFLLKISLCYMASINAIGENCWALSIEEFQFGTYTTPSLFYIQEEIEPWEIVRPFTPRALSFSPSSSICLEQIFSCSFLLSLYIYKPNPIPGCSCPFPDGFILLVSGAAPLLSMFDRIYF
jgi:hypothetical protein